MPYIPYAPQLGAKYVLARSNGARAVFNDTSDPDCVGVLSELVGLDSAEVRESFEDLSSADGGFHGSFYYGRRKISMNGSIYGHGSHAQRDAKIDKLRRASGAMRDDASLSWRNRPEASNVEMFTPVRRQQPLRITGGWNKTFQLQLVSEYSQLFSFAEQSTGEFSLAGGAGTVENRGDYDAYPIITLSDVSDASIIRNDTTGQVLRLTGTLGLYMDVDMGTHIAYSGDTILNHFIDYPNTSWPHLVSGVNQFSMAAGPGSFRLRWRDAWS